MRSSKSRACVSLPLVLILIFLASLPIQAGGPVSPGQDPTQAAGKSPLSKLKYAPDRILVRFKPGVSNDFAQFAHRAVGAQAVGSFRSVDRLQVVRLPEGMPVQKALGLYRQNPDVLYAEPDYVRHILAFPSDPRFNELWNLHNTGQSGGWVDADIDAPEAWDFSTGSSGVVVAVIDTGMDYSHEDLAANMFRNEPDCNRDGIDNDGNGFTDDCFGIDTFNDDSDPKDDHNHGTHVAGTIGAVGNNGLGVVGVNWTVKPLACKWLDFSGFGFDSDAIDCFDYVAVMKDRGVNIVATNNSWGGVGWVSPKLCRTQLTLNDSAAS